MKRFVAGLGLGLAGGLVAGVVVMPQLAPVPPTPVIDATAPRTETATPEPASAPPAAAAPRPVRAPSVRVRQPARPKPEEGRGTRNDNDGGNDDDEDPFAGWSAEDFLDELVRAGSDAESHDSDDVAGELRERFPDAVVPYETVLALLRPLDGPWGEKVHAAISAIHTWPADLARRALDLAVAESGQDGRLLRRIVSHIAERVAESGSGDSSLFAVLAGSDDETLRIAAVDIGVALESPPLDDLVRIATSDVSEGARVYAIEAVASIAFDDADATAAARIAPLILLAAREGSPWVRWAAIEQLPNMGAEGADAALSILQEEALGEDLLYPLVGSVVQAGRLPEFLAHKPSRRETRIAAWNVSEGELTPEDLDALTPHLPVLIDALEPDDTADLIWAFSNADGTDVLEQIVTGAEFTASARENALYSLHGCDVEGAAERAFALATDILRNPRAHPAELRRRVVDVLSAFMDEVYEGESLPVGITTLQAVERSDPSYWVRAAATETLGYWEE